MNRKTSASGQNTRSKRNTRSNLPKMKAMFKIVGGFPMLMLLSGCYCVNVTYDTVVRAHPRWLGNINVQPRYELCFGGENANQFHVYTGLPSNLKKNLLLTTIRRVPVIILSKTKEFIESVTNAACLRVLCPMQSLGLVAIIPFLPSM